MKTDLHARIEALQRMPCAELRELWRETFGEDPRSGNVPWMRRRLAWGVQAQALGGLSEAAKQRIQDLTPVALASMPWGFRSFPERNGSVPPVKRDRRIPTPGTTLARRYKGQMLEVLVRADGFEYDGTIYASLSAVAKAITGSHWNGNLFWFGRSRDRKTA